MRIQTLWRDRAALDAMRASLTIRQHLGCCVQLAPTPSSHLIDVKADLIAPDETI